jgi:predicted phosphodiesterase
MTPGAAPGCPALGAEGANHLKAIISDIHGNLEALEAVLADIKQKGITEILCLGDIIGYGPNPRECIDKVMATCKLSLLGNHDQGALFDPEGFNPGAERAIFWTREQLEKGDPRGNEKRWEYLGELPRFHKDGDLLFVHGSARNPLNEYVFPEDIYNQRKMERIFSLVPKYCFQGHTHVPGVFTESLKFFRQTSTSNTIWRKRKCWSTSARSGSRATATGGDRTSCSTAKACCFSACNTISIRRSRRSTTSRNWITFWATGFATAVSSLFARLL